MLLSVIEFAFAFNAVLATDFSSRDAALAGAEAGNAAGADCVILQTRRGRHARAGRPVADPGRRDLPRPTRTATIGEATIYNRTGSMACTFPDGTCARCRTRGRSNGYAETTRCNVLAGCGGSRPTIDHIGVKVTYRYTVDDAARPAFGAWLDGFPSRSNVMRMEPIL